MPDNPTDTCLIAASPAALLGYLDDFQERTSRSARRAPRADARALGLPPHYLFGHALHAAGRHVLNPEHALSDSADIFRNSPQPLRVRQHFKALGLVRYHVLFVIRLATFDLVTSRIAPHHFSSPEKFVREAARVLKLGGHLLVIDGSVPDDDPETEAWLHRVEKWHDPSHHRLLSRKTWEALASGAGLKVVRSELYPFKQPDVQWWFDTSATSPENREKVLEAVRTASEHVRRALRLANEDGKVIWWWPRLTLLASKPA